jgi:hypothetical protein
MLLLKAEWQAKTSLDVPSVIGKPSPKFGCLYHTVEKYMIRGEAETQPVISQNALFDLS